jgi:hypothetical protein
MVIVEEKYKEHAVVASFPNGLQVCRATTPKTALVS